MTTDLGYLNLGLQPGLRFPVSSTAEYITTGGGGGFILEYALPQLPYLGFRLSAETDIMPVVTADNMLTTNLLFGPAFNIEMPAGFGLSAWGGLGYYYTTVAADDEISGGNLVLSAGLGASYSFNKNFSLGLNGDYSWNRLLSQTIGVSLTGKYSIRLKTKDIGPPLIIENSKLQPVFPVLHQHYDSAPFGTVVIKNNRDRPIYNISAEFFIDRYMTDPKTCISSITLEPEETAEIPVYALFDSNILEILESTKVSYKLTLSYVYRGKSYKDEHFDTLVVENRNASVWDDDRKVAAFVSTLDPEVMTFARVITSQVRKTTYGNLVEPLKSAIALYEALRVYDLRYTVDAATPFAEFSEDPLMVDYLQFPRQTLQYKAGDCDDLAILFNALLQSANVHTAFITVPGHIFPAFSTGLSPEQAEKRFSNTADLIPDHIRNTTWVPFEITALDRDFLGAWEIGAREWKEAEDSGDAVLIPTEDAWQVYQPVWYRPATASERAYFIELPDSESVQDTFNRSLKRYVRTEVNSLTEELVKKLETDSSNAGLLNRLGVVYAANGMLGEAKKTFESAIAADPGIYSARVNLGNIAYLDGDYQRALDLFEKAESIKPGGPKLMITMIELYYDLGRSESAVKLYSRLRDRYPETAEKNSHLSSEFRYQTRASEASNLYTVFWTEAEE